MKLRILIGLMLFFSAVEAPKKRRPKPIETSYSSSEDTIVLHSESEGSESSDVLVEERFEGINFKRFREDYEEQQSSCKKVWIPAIAGGLILVSLLHSIKIERTS